jgi:hypothetical protein
VVNLRAVAVSRNTERQMVAMIDECESTGGGGGRRGPPKVLT